MLGRLSRPADFEAVLATPVKARSAHFAAYHLPQCPRDSSKFVSSAEVQKLSTSGADTCAQPVDDLRPGPSACWFGVIIPKRQARRAVTRNLLRRQVRCALARHRGRLARGMWLVRLRSPFAADVFMAAASAALRDAARAELDALLTRAAA